MSKDDNKNRFEVHIWTESGCNVEDFEYNIYIVGILNGLIDKDDYPLVEECIHNHLDTSKLPKEGLSRLVVKETGEWEDVFWHKYYEIAEQEVDINLEITDELPSKTL